MMPGTRVWMKTPVTKGQVIENAEFCLPLRAHSHGTAHAKQPHTLPNCLRLPDTVPGSATGQKVKDRGNQ